MMTYILLYLALLGQRLGTQSLTESDASRFRVEARVRTAASSDVVCTTDGHRVISCGVGIEIRDGATLALTWTGGSDYVRYSQISIDRSGRHLVAASAGSELLEYWDLATGIPTLVWRTFEFGPTAVAISPAGDLLAVASTKAVGTLSICDLLTGYECLSIEAHNDSITCVAFANGGSCVVTGSLDGSIRVWNIENGELMTTISTQGGWVYYMAFCEETTSLAVATYAARVVIRSGMFLGQERFVYTDSDVMGVGPLCFIGGGDRLAFVVGTRRLRCADLSTTEVSEPLPPYNHPRIRSMAALGRLPVLITCDSDGYMSRWNVGSR